MPSAGATSTTGTTGTTGKAVALFVHDAAVHRLLTDALTSEGYAVRSLRGSARSAVAAEIARHRPDVLVLDTGPAGENLVLLDALRTVPETSRTAVVTISLTPDQRQQGQASGNVHTALAMPFDLSDLLDAVSAAAARRPAETRLLEQPLEDARAFHRAGAVLTAAERDVMLRWVQRARTTPPLAGRPDIDSASFLDALPRILNLVVLALRHQTAPEDLETFSETRDRIRHHAHERFVQALPIDACAREYQILAEELRDRLRREMPAEEVLAVLPKLSALLDECLRIAIVEFNRLAIDAAPSPSPPERGLG